MIENQSAKVVGNDDWRLLKTCPNCLTFGSLIFKSTDGEFYHTLHNDGQIEMFRDDDSNPIVVNTDAVCRKCKKIGSFVLTCEEIVPC